MEKEIWKDVKSYEGLYQVSNFGNVRSLDREIPAFILNQEKVTRIGKVLKPQVSNAGYEVVAFSKSGITKRFLVHRIVGKAFLKNEEQKEQINHKNGIKIDNVLKNLEWATRSENQLHRFEVLGHKDATRIGIKCITLGIETESTMEMNDILLSMGISSPSSNSVLSKYLREKDNPWFFKGLEFCSVE